MTRLFCLPLLALLLAASALLGACRNPQPVPLAEPTVTVEPPAEDAS